MKLFMNQDSSQSKSSLNRKLIVGILLLTSLIVTFTFATKYFDIQENFKNLLAWIDSLGFLAPVTFILIYILATVLFIPGSILTLGSGFVFGVIWGSIYVFIGATLGATAAFLVGRYLARGWVSQQIENNSKFKAIDQAVKREGFKVVLLARVSQIFPFNILNYSFGVTQVSLKDYFLASIGMIPGTIMYVYIGSLAGNLATIGAANQPTNPETEAVKWVIRVVGFIATVAVTIYVTRIARKALEESVNQEEL